MQCSYETLVRFFYNVSSSFLLLFLFFYFTSIFLARLVHYCGTPIFQRSQEEYDFSMFSEDGEEEEGGGEKENHDAYFGEESAGRNHLVADTIDGGESLQCFQAGNPQERLYFGEDVEKSQEPTYGEPEEEFSSPASESQLAGDEDVEEEIQATESNSDKMDGRTTTPPTLDVNNTSLDYDQGDQNRDHHQYSEKGSEKEQTSRNMMMRRDEKFIIFAPPKSEARKVEVEEKDMDEEIFGDSCTVGSTSKSSSEWRSSINYRDSATEDPFSSSSRRSCPKWESYTVFQKYDEEMLFLDRISAQKLHETESLRSIQACPRSISERIVYKLGTRKKGTSNSSRQNPYQELEGAYVAQICLTWEALNWNFNYFQRLRASRRQCDPGCPAYVAQQFQQFQVLLQRYVENEPYEHGRRPQIYARMRAFAPKLLQVPEYRDSYDEEKEELGAGSRIPSESFLQLMAEGIRTFMNFLKADRESHCQILASFFRRNRRGSIDPTRLLFLKKENKKKKLKLKDLYRTRKCLRKRRLREEEEMEILMALIDIKVVSRVLRMSDLSEEQVQWCDEKMNKVKVTDRKLQRDSKPLFFPAH